MRGARKEERLKRTLVTFCDRVVRVVGALRASNDMTPPCTYARPSGDVDDIAILELDSLIARNFRIIHVLDWLLGDNGVSGRIQRREGGTHVVGARSADALQLPLVNSIHGHFL